MISSVRKPLRRKVLLTFRMKNTRVGGFLEFTKSNLTACIDKVSYYIGIAIGKNAIIYSRKTGDLYSQL